MLLTFNRGRQIRRHAVGLRSSRTNSATFVRAPPRLHGPLTAAGVAYEADATERHQSGSCSSRSARTCCLKRSASVSRASSPDRDVRSWGRLRRRKRPGRREETHRRDLRESRANRSASQAREVNHARLWSVADRRWGVPIAGESPQATQPALPLAGVAIGFMTEIRNRFRST